MRPVPLAQQPMSLDPLRFGELVHEVLKRAVDKLESDAGFVQSSRDQIESALSAAIEHICEQWPLERPVPPALLWGHTLDEAARRALRGLTTGRSFQQGTRSWTELEFGKVGVHDPRSPWPADREVLLGEERVRLGGRIDRVDIAAAGDRVRISDYKTGKTPPNADRIVLDGGKEVQRVLYAMAIRQMLPEATTVISRLVYLDADSPPYSLDGDALDAACVSLAQSLDAACRLVRRGRVCPGLDAENRYHDLRLALPAESDAYFRRKRASFAGASRDLSPLWSAR
jgi:ATP-dependent helicase/DNAse subunit B